jgi:hypothetical protein
VLGWESVETAERFKGDAAVAGIGAVVMAEMETGLCIALGSFCNALNPHALLDLAFGVRPGTKGCGNGGIVAKEEVWEM